MLQLLRAVWRYRARIEALGARGQTEVATALRSAIEARVVGRHGLRGYRLAMRALLAGAAACFAIAVIVAVMLWQTLGAPWAALAVLPLIPAGLLLMWRFAWGAPLDWLDEFADPDRTVPLAELPTRLRAIAADVREVANVPRSISRELEELADHVDSAPRTDQSIVRSSEPT